MNQQHLDILGTDEWRQTLEDRVLPFAFGPLGPDALGDDVLEVGPGPGMTTDLLRGRLPQLTSIELDPDAGRRRCVPGSPARTSTSSRATGRRCRSTTAASAAW